MSRALLALFLPVLFAACPGRSAEAGARAAQPADSVPEAVQVTVELTARPLHGGDDGGGRVTAQPASGGVAVQGALSTPNPCYTLHGQARRDGSIVTLTVEARAGDGICTQSIGAFSYDATVRGLPSGTYEFRVIHTYPGTGWETRPALSTSITIP